jgi:DNA-binding NarL/FixJ family response regulator
VEHQVGVLILCCNRLLRESIAHILVKKPDFQVIGTAPISPTSRQEITESCADVLVLDSLQFVLEAEMLFPRARTDKRSIKCVLVAMEDDQERFVTAVRHGVLGYVLQEASAVDVVTAIRAVAAGQAMCPPRFTRVLFDFVVSRAGEFPGSLVRDEWGLSRREQQLIPLICQGFRNKEIAKQLNLSEQTVKNHVHRILQKIGVQDRSSIIESCQIQTLGLQV